jgi:hypothetical protein
MQHTKRRFRKKQQKINSLFVYFLSGNNPAKTAPLRLWPASPLPSGLPAGICITEGHPLPMGGCIFAAVLIKIEADIQP